jgi:hypothetical protein
LLSGTTLAMAGESKGAGRRCRYPSHPPLCWCFTVGEQDESEIPGEEVCRGKEADNKAEMMESASAAALRWGQGVSDEQEV